MTAEPSVAQLRANHDRVAALLEDRTLSGDLLLIGLAFAHVVDFHPSSEWKLDRLARWLFPTPPHAHGPAHTLGAAARIARVLRNDIRRYAAPRANDRCSAPVRGRDDDCGRPGTGLGGTLTDLITGNLTHLSACARHVNWLRILLVENRDACEMAQVPVPCANTGGVLRHHFPELDWPAFWLKLDPQWVEAPEVDEVHPVRAVPRLRVLDGDGAGGPGRIPVLRVVRDA